MASKKVYQCGRCGNTHDYEEEAEECCAPEVFEVWECESCADTHEDEEDADRCCPEVDDEEAASLCPACFRDYPTGDIAVAAIEHAGHCQTCNPIFTVEQHHEIESQHELLTGAYGFSLSRGDSGSVSRW